VFWFSIQLLSEIFFTPRIIRRDTVINLCWSSCTVPVSCYSCQILMKLAFVQQIFEKYGSVKFHENPSSGSRTFACGRTDEQTGGETDRHDATNRSFSHFCESVYTRIICTKPVFWGVWVALSIVERKTFAYCFRGQVGAKRNDREGEGENLIMRSVVIVPKIQGVSLCTLGLKKLL